MSILVTCQCGHVTRARSDLAGKELICPVCGKICSVPVSEARHAPTLARADSLCLRCRTPLPVGVSVCSECGLDVCDHSAPKCVVRVEREIGMCCLAPIVFSLLLASLLLDVADRTGGTFAVTVMALAVTALILPGTRTHYDILRDGHGLKLCSQFSLAWLPLRSHQTDMSSVRTIMLDYKNYHLRWTNWLLALVLTFCGVLPGLIYIRWILGDDVRDSTIHEMYFVSLADADGRSLLRLEFRREKQMRAMLQMLTSAVDIDVERA